MAPTLPTPKKRTLGDSLAVIREEVSLDMVWYNNSLTCQDEVRFVPIARSIEFPMRGPTPHVS